MDILLAIKDLNERKEISNIENNMSNEKLLFTHTTALDPAFSNKNKKNYIDLFQLYADVRNKSLKSAFQKKIVS